MGPAFPQPGSSLSPSFSGQLEVDLTTNGSFSITGSVHAVTQQGDFQPYGGPADYAVLIDLPSPPMRGYSTLRGMTGDLAGSATRNTDGFFDASAIQIDFGDTSWSWDAPGLSSGTSPFQDNGWQFAPIAASTGSLRMVENRWQLRIPVEITHTQPIYFYDLIDWSLTGQLFAFADALVPGVVGDANGDCSVGAADYAIWAAQFGQFVGSISADFDENGSVGTGDYALWAANFGNTCATGAKNVPEPSALALCLLGLALLAAAQGPEAMCHAIPTHD